MPTVRRPQVKHRAGCPGEVALPGPQTLTGLCLSLPKVLQQRSRMQQQGSTVHWQQDWCHHGSGPA